jgi:hypothetical protein
VTLLEARDHGSLERRHRRLRRRAHHPHDYTATTANAATAVAATAVAATAVANAAAAATAAANAAAAVNTESPWRRR